MGLESLGKNKVECFFYGFFNKTLLFLVSLPFGKDKESDAYFEKKTLRVASCCFLESVCFEL